MHCTKSKNPKVVLKERAEIVVVRRFLTYECGCGPHCAVRTAPHTTVRVVVKPSLGVSALVFVLIRIPKNSMCFIYLYRIFRS